MNDLVILGTDTDAGKTTFALLWLAAFADRYEYWKPLESGDSDKAKVRRLVPAANCHAPLHSLARPVAPALAARSEGITIPAARDIAACRPAPAAPGRRLLIETFGSPLSPLNETELQIELLRHYGLPTLLVCSSTVGAVGRTLQCLAALRGSTTPSAIVLLGPEDPYAVEEVARHGGLPVFHLHPPADWTAEGVSAAATEQLQALNQIRVITAPPPHQQFAISNLQSKDRQLLWHPYASLRDPDPPLVAVAARDEFIRLADGRTVIDAFSSWWTILHGHRPPHLMAALAEATEAFDHVAFSGMTHAPAVRLAELLLSTAPWPGGRVFYSDNGSTAVEVALKMAYQYWCHRGEPQRTLFIGFEHGYHGDTFGAMAASRDPVFFGRFEPLLFRTDIVPIDPDRLAVTLDRHQGRVAAVIIEPLVQGAGGMQMHSPEQLRALFEVARDHDVLFIADEVMTGGGRLGPLWAHSLASIAPDLICASKTLAGGILPLAATLVAPHVAAEFDTDDRSKSFFHGHSFTAHPLACHVAAVNWQHMTTSDNPHPARIESCWQAHLGPLRNHPNVRDIRIRGSIAAVELDTPGGYLAESARRTRHICLEHGAFLRPLGNVVYAMPPLCTSEESLARIAEAIHRSVI